MVQVDDTRQQKQISSSSKRTWAEIGEANRQAEYNQSLANTGRSTSSNTTNNTSSNKLIDVLKPPTTPLTPYLPKGNYNTGYSTIQKPSSNQNTSSGSSSGTNSQMTTYTTPTPSSSIISGTTQQREEQIKSYQQSYSPSKGNTITQQIAGKSKEVQKGYETRIEPLSGTGYIKPINRNFLEPFISPSSYKKGVLGFIGDVFESSSESGQFTFKGSKTKQFETREKIRENVASKKKYEVIEPYLKMSQGKGYEEFFKSKINPIIEQRKNEYTNLYSKKQKEVEQEYALAKLRISSGADYKSTINEYESKVSKINKELNSFEFPNTTTDKLGQQVSSLPKVFQSPNQFGISSSQKITPYSETQKIVDKNISGEFKLLQEGYKEIGRNLKIQEVGENIGDVILTNAPFLIGPVNKGLNVNKLSFGDDMRIRENVNQLSNKGFKFNEIRFDAETQTSIIKGSRSSNGLTQEVDIVLPKIINKENSFYVPYGKYSATTSGVIKPDLVGNQKPIIFQSYQQGSLGSKGFSLQTGQEGYFATIGKGTLIPEIETSGFVYAEKNLLKQFDMANKDILTFYHGTSSDLAPKYLSKGITPKQGYKEVFTAKTPEEVYGFATRNIYKSGSNPYNLQPKILEIKLPKSEFERLKVNRSEGIGGVNEFTFSNIPAKYIKEYDIKNLNMFGNNIKSNVNKYNLDLPKNFKQDMFEQLKRNIKIKEGEYSSDTFFGVTKSLGKGFDTQIGEFEGYLTKSGKINKIIINPTKDFGSFKTSRQGALIDTNLKDITFTRVTGKPNIEKDFYIKSGKNELALKTVQKSKPQTEFIPKATIQQFKQELKPSLKFNTGFKMNSQSLNVLTPLKYKSSSFSKFTSISLFNKNNINNNYFSGLNSKDLSLFSQSSALMNIQSNKQNQLQAQSFKLDLGTKQINQEQFSGYSGFNFNPFYPSGFGGGGGGFGFAIPSFSLGANYLYSKPKKKSKRKKQKIRPSFTAQVFDITGSLPKQGKYGVNPFDIRKVPKSKRYSY